MSRALACSLVLALSACSAKTSGPAPEALGASPSRTAPEPLEIRAFQMPATQRGALSNGLEVVVVPNHEVPLFELSLVLRVGTDANPVGKEGLASVTFDMLDEGAAGRDAAAITRETRQLGGGISTASYDASSVVSVSGPVKNLDGLLDLWADVLLRPDFPEADWSILQTRRIQGLEAALEDPNSVARRVGNHIVYGDRFTGRLTSTDAYASMTTDDMRAWYADHVGPGHAVLMVGGDVMLDTLLPKLEARLGSWSHDATSVPPDDRPMPMLSERVVVVDQPGAAQTVIVGTLPVMARRAPDYRPFYLANTALGGAFTARVNMNLREDKGWTYGARCGMQTGSGQSVWRCSTSVQTDQTVPSLKELRREVAEVGTTRPVTADELAFFRSYRVHTFQTSYETPRELLGELREIWLYDLPSDWLERYVPDLDRVTLEQAHGAISRWLVPDRVTWLLVGDVSTFEDDLAKLGLPVQVVDTSGRPVVED